MQQKCHARITQIGNSKVVKQPEELMLSVDTTDVILEQTGEGILIKPIPAIPPLSEWAALFAAADRSPESELNDWDITLQDGLENK